MVDYTFQQTGHTGILTFYGDLTASRESQIRSALMSALGIVEHLVFDLHRVRRLDTTCLRFFQIAQQISRSMNKRLTFVGLAK
jgi:anti-anti-sigma regulatory factor